MRQAIRIDTLQWFMGLYIAIRGTLMLMLPQQLSTHVFVPIQPFFPWLGTWQVIGGVALIISVTLVSRRRLAIAAHLVAGSALLQGSIGHILAGTWTGAAGFATLGLGTAIAPFLSKIQPPHPKPTRLDLFALLMGIRIVIDGILLLAPFNRQFNASLYDPIRSYLWLYGVLHLVSGLLVLAVHLSPKLPRWLFRFAHILAGGILWAWTVSLGFPTLNSILYFGGLGTLLALLPWLRNSLTRLDPASLQTLLAVTLVGIVTLPLLSLVTLVSIPYEHAVVNRALLVQQSVAIALSQDISSYVGLHRAAAIALAKQLSLASMTPIQQRTLLQIVTQAYPDIVVFTTFDAVGNAIARSDNLPLSPSIADFSSFQTARRTGEAVLDIRIGRVLEQPIIVAIAPFYTPQGQFAGVVAAAIESERVAQQLARVQADANITAYLVDNKGRVIAHPDSSLVRSFTDFSDIPPVAALLKANLAGGRLHYWNNSAWQLVGYARVPDFNWGVVVERPASEVLATLNDRRNRDFALLVIVAGAALVIGWLLARQLTAPLTLLADAAGQLATGNPQAPLPHSQITEVAHLSAVFGAMRESLEQRAAERDRAEADLRHSEAKFRRLVESNVIGTIVAQLNGSILEANDAFLQMVGYDREDLHSGQIRWSEMTPPEYFEVSQHSIKELKTKGVCTPFEKEYIRKDGSRVPVLIGSALLEETPDKVIGFVFDLTERKQMEREREQLLSRERSAREEAEVANRIKDEFLAVLSHELRSPLNPILGWAKLLRSRKFDEQTVDKALETIERNAKLQTQLIEDLLDVSRILRGKLVLKVSAVNLATTIEAAIETVRLAAEAKSIQLKTHLDPTVGSVSGDSTRLQQVVWNLVSNAVKFTPSGGRVDVILERVDAMATIQVKDSGKGIAKEFLPYVFEYFRQEDGTTTRKFGGLGLGLAIVRYLVEQHGGSVIAESPGEELGATFTVRLPLMADRQSQAQPEKKPLSGFVDLSGLRVLIVDDEPDIREFVAFTLEEAGAEAIVSASASEVLATLNRVLPDILVCDIGMPEVDGYTLMREVRALPAERGGQIKAIALTAYAAESDRQRSQEAGFQLHLPKPVEPAVLVMEIARVVGRV